MIKHPPETVRTLACHEEFFFIKLFFVLNLEVVSVLETTLVKFETGNLKFELQLFVLILSSLLIDPPPPPETPLINGNKMIK